MGFYVEKDNPTKLFWILPFHLDKHRPEILNLSYHPVLRRCPMFLTKEGFTTPKPGDYFILNRNPDGKLPETAKGEYTLVTEGYFNKTFTPVDKQDRWSLGYLAFSDLKMVQENMFQAKKIEKQKTEEELELMFIRIFQ